MADCVAAQTARKGAVERGTHKKQARSWRRWEEYLQSIGLKDNVYLKQFSREQWHTLIGEFAVAIMEARFLRKSHGQLAANTVGGTIQYLSVSFREHGYPNPPSTKTANLHGFYNESLGCSKTKTHQRNTKQQSPCLLCPQSTNETPQNLNEQPSNLSHSESSLQCNPASTSRYINPNNAGPTSSDFATSVSSVVARNSTMTTQN